MDRELVFKMKELTRLAKEKGKILHVSEAFKVYPAEEEAHKGKAEYWVDSGDVNEM